MVGKDLGRLEVTRPVDGGKDLHLYRAAIAGHMYYALAPTPEFAIQLIEVAVSDEVIPPQKFEIRAYRDERPIRGLVIKSPDPMDTLGPGFLETHVTMGFELEGP